MYDLSWKLYNNSFNKKNTQKNFLPFDFCLLLNFYKISTSKWKHRPITKSTKIQYECYLCSMKFYQQKGHWLEVIFYYTSKLKKKMKTKVCVEKFVFQTNNFNNFKIIFTWQKYKIIQTQWILVQNDIVIVVFIVYLNQMNLLEIQKWWWMMNGSNGDHTTSDMECCNKCR